MAPEEAFSYALKLLSNRPRSKSHLASLLKKKGYEEADVDQALKRLEELHLINDKLFAEQATEHLLARQPSGRKRVWDVLRKKKVPSEIAKEVVGKLDREGEHVRAFELAKVYQEKWKDLPSLKRRKRIYDLLVRRGFDFELCREVIDSIR